MILKIGYDERGMNIEIEGVIEFSIVRNILGLNMKDIEMNYEIENRLCYGYIIGLIDGLKIKYVEDSEGNGIESSEEYRKEVMNYLNDDMDNYY